MSGEDQERFEDYLELEHYIEELQAGRVAHPPSDLTPAQARIYRMAALFRSASPEASEPRPEFVEKLRAKLLAEDQADAEADTLKIPKVKQDGEPIAAPAPIEKPSSENIDESAEHHAEPEVPVPPTHTNTRKGTPRRASFFSRRSLLTGGAVAAASLVVGGSIGAMAEHSAAPPPPVASNSTPTNNATPTSTPYNTGGNAMPLVPDGTLHKVGLLDQIGKNAVRFTTETIVGYVIRVDEDDEGETKGEKIIAFSAACTHMGCLVQWKSEDRQFYCPCHDGIFTEYGAPSPHSAFKYLASLPRMQTVIQDGYVYVLVPKQNT